MERKGRGRKRRERRGKGRERVPYDHRPIKLAGPAQSSDFSAWRGGGKKGGGGKRGEGKGGEVIESFSLVIPQTFWAQRADYRKRREKGKKEKKGEKEKLEAPGPSACRSLFVSVGSLDLERRKEKRGKKKEEGGGKPLHCRSIDNEVYRTGPS